MPSVNWLSAADTAEHDRAWALGWMRRACASNFPTRTSLSTHLALGGQVGLIADSGHRAVVVVQRRSRGRYSAYSSIRLLAVYDAPERSSRSALAKDLMRATLDRLWSLDVPEVAGQISWRIQGLNASDFGELGAVFETARDVRSVYKTGVRDRPSAPEPPREIVRFDGATPPEFRADVYRLLAELGDAEDVQQAVELDMLRLQDLVTHVVVHGSRVIGVSRLGLPGTATAHQLGTVVDAAVRGRGLAKALKRSQLAFVETLPAINEIETWCTADNALIRRINRDLGFLELEELARWRIARQVGKSPQ